MRDEAAVSDEAVDKPPRSGWHETGAFLMIGGLLVGLGIVVVLAMFIGVGLKVPFLVQHWTPMLAGIHEATVDQLAPTLGPTVAPIASWVLPGLLCWGLFAFGERCGDWGDKADRKRAQA